MNHSFKAFLEQFSTNQSLSEPTATAICNHLTILNHSKKHILISENQRQDFAYFLISGAVRSYYLKDGIEVNTWFAFEGDMAGSLQNFKDKPSRETIELIEDSTLISIDLREIKLLMFSNIQVANFINAIVEEYALFLEDKIYFSQLTSAMDRYEMLLEKEPKVFLRVPLTYIASYLGISRETLSRLRAK